MPVTLGNVHIGLIYSMENCLKCLHVDHINSSNSAVIKIPALCWLTELFFQFLNFTWTLDGPRSSSTSKTKVWMFWWNTCPMHKVMPREYLKDGMTLLEIKYFISVDEEFPCCPNCVDLKWRVLKMVAPFQTEQNHQIGQWKTWPRVPAAPTHHMGWAELLVRWL